MRQLEIDFITHFLGFKCIQRLGVLATFVGTFALLTEISALQAQQNGESAKQSRSYPNLEFKLENIGSDSSIYIEYKPTGKKLIIRDSSGVARLSARHLAFLGVQAGEKIDAKDFVVNKVYGTDEVLSVETDRQESIRPWIKGPNEKRLLLEQMKTYKTDVSPGKVAFNLRPNFILLAQADLPRLRALELAKKNAEARRAARKESLQLLEESWEHLRTGKYDRSLVGFTLLQEKSMEFLQKDEQEKVEFGFALSQFHQLGCSTAYPSFKKLLRPGEFEDDAIYYGGLCALDANETDVSKMLFKKILSRGSDRYEEEARLYLGVVSEAEEDYEAAESAYLDTIDFAEKAPLVKLAQQRLALLKAKKARKKYNEKIFSFMANTGIGWDSNALSLPIGTQPASQGLETGSSPSYLALAFLDIKNPLLFPLQQKFFYSFLMMGYTESQIAESTDIQSHEFGANITWGSPLAMKHTVSASGSLTYLGKIGSSSKYLTGYSAKWDGLSYTLGEDKKLKSSWAHSFKLARSIPENPSSEADEDTTAWVATGSHTQKIFKTGYSWGPMVGYEYRLAKGKENTSLAVEFGGNYSRPLMEKSYKLNFSQDLSLTTDIFLSNSDSRKDFLLSSSTSVSRMMTTWLETRFQIVYDRNFSNLESARFNRIQANLLFTAFF